MSTLRARLSPGLLALALAALPAAATNGYFAHGYGLKAKGMGGAATALAQDAFGGANNPASFAFVGARFDVGGDVFRPVRDAEREGALGLPLGLFQLDGASRSNRETFLIPEFGLSRPINERLGLGLTVYGNGGLNTAYSQGNYSCLLTGFSNNQLCGQGKLGVDLIQLVVAPSLAWRFSEKQAFGISLLLTAQQFQAQGLQAFDNTIPLFDFTSRKGKVTNRGKDRSYGAGLRVGYMGRFFDERLSVGAAYASRTRMSRFKKYEGLFAEQGDFDIPSNWSLGLALKLSPSWTLALDANRIRFSEVRSVGNPSASMALLGQDKGPGFGWRDIDVLKLGLIWQATPRLALRAGVNVGDNPIRGEDVTFNILAPGVVRKHFTLGFTQSLDDKSELTGAFMIAPRESVRGTSFFDQAFGVPGIGGEETIRMRQVSVGLAYGRSF